ncbi:hypothetical protein ACVWXO_002284 [Bradyrhizobium sp. LM2.7]
MQRIAQDVVGFGLHLIELFGRFALPRCGDHVEKPFAQMAVGVALILFQIAGEPCAERAHGRERHQAPPDVIAVLVQEGLFLAVNEGSGTGMDGNHCILVGVGRLDLGGERELRHQLLAHREKLTRERRDCGLRQGFARHDVMREADGLDLVVGTIGRAAVGAGGNFSRLIDRMVLSNRIGGIDRKKGRRSDILCGGRNCFRRDLAVDRTCGEIGIDLLGADRLGGFIGRELRDLDLGGIDTVLLEDHLKQVDVGLGAADHADAMAGELRDLGDLGALLLALGGHGPQHHDVLAQGRNGLRVLRHVEIAADDGEIGLALRQ